MHMLIPRHITGLPPAMAFRHISGVMMHPDDGALAEEFKCMALAEGWLSDHPDQETFALPRTVVQGLLAAARRGAAKDVDRGDKAGGMAGNLLLYVLRGQEAGIPDFGVDKAAFLVSEMWRRQGEFQGAIHSGKGAGRDTVLKSWTKYRPVAHLWAAYDMLASFGAATDDFDPDDLQTAADWVTQDRSRFLAAAQGLLVAASKCALPRRDGLFLLDPEQCWGLEDIVPIDLKFPPLHTLELTILEGFEPRFRT